jgi:hypothetical protein
MYLHSFGFRISLLLSRQGLNRIRGVFFGCAEKVLVEEGCIMADEAIIGMSKC